MARVSLKVNGASRLVDVRPDTSLLDALREQLDLTGTKYGCGEGQCGACTVQIDGTAVRSCVIKAASVAGKEILTSEGLAAAFVECLQADTGKRARAYGARLRKSDGAELAVAAFHRHLPLAAMQCSCRPERLATLFCEQCEQHACAICAPTAHAGHPLRAYRYVDWTIRPPHTVSRIVRELLDDAAAALRVGLEEIGLVAPPRRDGVILHDEAVADAPPCPGPVRRQAAGQLPR